MYVIIQIPCYNEEKTLAVTIADLPRSIEGVDRVEYLVINDGSTDNTVEEAKRLGVHHVVGFRNNRGLAKGFMAGLDAALHLGADIIVNTDADNQYCGADIAKLVQPIIEKKADIVIGERPILDTKHFSPLKKLFQRLGSFVVRVASNTKIPDAPSGFRAYSREAALRMNVTNDYTYTLETIIQAGRNKMAITSVPIRTNPELRKSRLFKSMWSYMKRSASVIARSYMMYRPLKFFGSIGIFSFLIGLALGIRFLILLYLNQSGGNVQSLILMSVLMIMGILMILVGLLGDMIASNRKLLEDIQYRVRQMDCSTNYGENMDIEDK